MFNYINREHHFYERQENLEVEKPKFRKFPIPAITERTQDGEEGIRMDTRACCQASVCHEPVG